MTIAKIQLNENRSPFGGIPRNWKLRDHSHNVAKKLAAVPPSGGSLEIGNEEKPADKASPSEFPLRGDP